VRVFPLRRTLSLIAVAIGGLSLLAGGSQAQDTSGVAISIELPGSIDPATEAWISGALEDAADDGAELAIIRLDTPGGLDTSMREIVKDVIAAPMPVVVYVYPDGARAASAGLFVTQAGDVAAMAPQTNIGSASPISISGADIDEVLGRKIENDAAAYVTALAEEHGRNAELAEEMVRDATNVSASEALDAGLIDVIAGSQEDLLAQLDGFVVKGPKAGELDTTGLEIEERDMPLQYDILQLIVNPNVSFLLILAGILGLAIELFSPGLILPGAFGLVSFVIGLYGSAQLPVTAAGVILLVVGVGLIVAEAQIPGGGVLGIVGVVALAVSGLMLYDTDEGLEISPPLVIGVALVLGGLLAVAVKKVVEARRGPVWTGEEELPGSEGDVRVALDPVGQVFVHGALWRAEPAGGRDGGPIPVGVRVRVAAVDGLTLMVEPLAKAEIENEGAG
jgi:membrane-bound serine protease (ClpP class)